MILSSIGKINTPLVPNSWYKHFQQHLNQQLVLFFLKGISEGFRIWYGGCARDLKSSNKNLHSALLHPQVVNEYIHQDWAVNKLGGRPIFTKWMTSGTYHCFGMIPKYHQVTKWCLIVMVYIDTCLSFGLHSALWLFSILADLIYGMHSKMESPLWFIT